MKAKKTGNGEISAMPMMCEKGFAMGLPFTLGQSLAKRRRPSWTRTPLRTRANSAVDFFGVSNHEKTFHSSLSRSWKDVLS